MSHKVQPTEGMETEPIAGRKQSSHVVGGDQGTRKFRRKGEGTGDEDFYEGGGEGEL